MMVKTLCPGSGRSFNDPGLKSHCTDCGFMVPLWTKEDGFTYQVPHRVVEEHLLVPCSAVGIACFDIPPESIDFGCPNCRQTVGVYYTPDHRQALSMHWVDATPAYRPPASAEKRQRRLDPWFAKFMSACLTAFPMILLACGWEEKQGRLFAACVEGVLAIFITVLGILNYLNARRWGCGYPESHCTDRPFLCQFSDAHDFTKASRFK